MSTAIEGNRLPLVVQQDNGAVTYGFGYPMTTGEDRQLVLHDARQVIYWPESIHGIGGLAAKGPSNACRIGPRVTTATLTGVNTIFTVSPNAAEKFSSDFWGDGTQATVLPGTGAGIGEAVAPNQLTALMLGNGYSSRKSA